MDIGYPGGNYRTTSIPRSVDRIMRSARAGITPIATTLMVAPMMTVGGAFANSTIQAAANTNIGGGVSANAEGPLISVTGGVLDPSNNRVSVATNNLVAPLPRAWGHGGGIKFATSSQTFDICFASFGLNYILYVTDLSTKIRQRFNATDFTTNNDSFSYYRKFDMGSRANRIIEFYGAFGFGVVTGINVPNGEAIWPINNIDEAKGVLLWDSYGQGVLSDGMASNPVKLAVPDYLGERLGIINIISCSVGGSGVVNPSGNRGSFQDRVNYGDINNTRIGDVDFVYVPVSVNDGAAPGAGGVTDGVIYPAYAALVASVGKAQPNAIIIGSGPQNTGAIPALQSRYDVAKAAFLAAGGNDKRFIYLDNSFSGENWYPNAALPSLLGPDNLHPLQAAAPYYGYRLGDSMISAIQKRFSV